MEKSFQEDPRCGICACVSLNHLFTHLQTLLDDGEPLEPGASGDVLAILALAQTLVILAEGIDLSSGPLVSFLGVVVAVFLHKGFPCLR